MQKIISIDSIKNQNRNDMDIIDLDNSWIQENAILDEISENRIKENMDSIDILYIYINNQSCISNFTSTKYNFKKDFDSIDIKNAIFEHINKNNENNKNNKKSVNAIKYKLFDVLLYNNEIEHFNIHDYSNRDETLCDGFLKSINIDNIVIPPSIFIFHQVNTLFVLLKEIPIIPKSILKNTTKSFKYNNSIALTKKVKISIENPILIKSKSTLGLGLGLGLGLSHTKSKHSSCNKTRKSANVLSINNIK